MSKNARDKRPYIRPVTRLELSEENIKLRWILVAVLLAVAAVAIGIGVKALLTTEPGWQTVAAESQELNCSRDFSLNYDFSDYGGNASAAYKQLTQVYSRATEEGYRIFSTEYESEDCGNVARINAHVNETVQVASALYRALALIVQYEDRHIFTGPAQAEYNSVFLSANDAEAILYDPAGNADQAEYLAALSAIIADDSMISLELLGENRVRLNVAQEYLDFAAEYGIEAFLDFGWMKNAFLADYLAGILKENGFTSGTLTSYDGFTVNLDDRGQEYNQNIFHREDKDIYAPANVTYRGPMSLVLLRDYPMVEEDQWHYHAYESGEITSIYLDPATGRCVSAVPELLVYSSNAGCAELVLQAARLFIAESLNTDDLSALAEKDVFALWFEDRTLRHTQSGLTVELLPQPDGVKFDTKQFE